MDRIRARILHGLRLIGAAVVAGLVAGSVAGLGSRLLMFLVRVINPTHNGMTTHSDAVVGRWTLDGTMGLIGEGAFSGVFVGAVLYLLVRRWIPGHGWRKGLVFGVVLLVLVGRLALVGEYEYVRYVPPWASVSLFALLFPLFGVVQAPLTERLGAGTQGPPRNAIVRWGGYVVLGAALLLSAVEDFLILRDVYRFF